MGKLLRPFFSYYGAKYRAAPVYPIPKWPTIIEPFAGAAGYASRYYDRQVVLYETNDCVYGVWKYLIAAKSSEILGLPLVGDDDLIDEFPISQEAKWLIGFHCNSATTSPRKRASKWMRSGARPNSYWGSFVRARLAENVTHIRHWRIHHKDGMLAPDHVGTWFIDPPYMAAGHHYKGPSPDYARLSHWCKSRRGQVMVCEQDGANWLPFHALCTIQTNSGKRGKGHSKEALWLRNFCPHNARMLKGK